MVQPRWKTVWRSLKKLKIELPYDPAMALLGIYHKNTDIVKRRGTCTPMLIAEKPDVGLDPITPGSRPEPKADAQPLCHPGAPENKILFRILFS